MLHYVDIHLRPDPEFASNHLMAALFSKLHRWLTQTQSKALAVSFPGYQEKPAGLGRTLRIIGPERDLARLMELDWLLGMRDHVDLQAPSPVPSSANQRTLRRVQAKSSPERLRRRQMRRHNLTPEEAQERVPDRCAAPLSLPFLNLTSASTGQRFKLFLRLGPPCEAALAGDFNAYGLSNTASIPWF